jgi:hypothetical protein
MWEPRCLTTLWAFMACYRHSFFLFIIVLLHLLYIYFLPVSVILSGPFQSHRFPFNYSNPIGLLLAPAFDFPSLYNWSFPLHVLHFHPEVGSSMCHQNIGTCLPNYMGSHPRRQYCWVLQQLSKCDMPMSVISRPIFEGIIKELWFYM